MNSEKKFQSVHVFHNRLYTLKHICYSADSREFQVKKVYEGDFVQARVGNIFFLLKATVTVCLHLNFESFLQYTVVSIILANFIANVVEVDVCPCVIMPCPPLSISFTVFPLY